MNTISPTKKSVLFLLLFACLWLQVHADKNEKNNQKNAYTPHSLNIYLAIGNLNIIGDVQSKSIWNQTKHWSLSRGFEFGMQFLLNKKNLYAEAGAIAGSAHGYNFIPTSGYLQAGPDNPWLLAGYTNRVYYNYGTKLRMLNLGALYATDKRKRFSTEAGLGVSAIVFSTWVDARNSRGNRYDHGFTLIENKHGTSPSNQKAIQTDLQNLFDGEFESPAEGYGSDDPSSTLIPAFLIKLGFEIKLVPELSIGIKNKLMITGNDLLDGQKWQERSGETIGNDAINYLSLELKYHLF